jgi:hypothetical protein
MICNNTSGLKRTLASFQQWRLGEMEFLFVDGASTDSGLKVAHRFYRP